MNCRTNVVIRLVVMSFSVLVLISNSYHESVKLGINIVNKVA